jgi:hypothetical protein
MKEILKHKKLASYIQNADYMDTKTITGEVSLRYFISKMLSYYPWWLLVLYRIREVMVNILGLEKHEKPETLPVIEPEALSFKPGETASFFIVHNTKEDTYWVAETPEDKHLKAYLGVVAEKQGSTSTKFHVFTSVTYLHWTGPVYFNLIRPFHHVVVRQMMKAGIKR